MRISLTLPLVAALALAFCQTHPALAGTDNSKQVNVQLANETIPLTSRAQTVGQFLGELSISLPTGSEAVVDPPLDCALHDGMSVNLRGVTVSRGTTERAIPVETKFTECYRFGPEGCEVVDPGAPGRSQVTCTIFSANGVEVGRRMSEEVEEPMRPRVMVCFKSLAADVDGPSTEQILADRAAPGPWNEAPQHYKRTVTMSATAYEPGPQSCGRGCCGRTACGLKAGYGVVAVDPGVIALGTRLYIEGYGYAVAGDTGGAILGNRIDLGFQTVDECYQFGRRKVQVYVLY